LLKGENLKFEVEHFHKDRHRIPLEVSTRLITMGSVNYIMASHRDISERTKAGLALRKSEEKLQSIIRVAPVGIGLVADRILLEVNEYLCNLLGYTRSDLIGKSSRILYASEEEFNRVGEVKYNQIATEGSGTVETIFKCKDSRLVNVILSSTPLDKNDYSKGVTFTVLDITERKKIELALRESEKRYRELFHNNPIPTYIFDETTLEFVEVNDATVENYGYSREEFASMTIKDILTDDYIPDLHVSLEKTGKDVFYTANMSHRKKSGHLFPVEITSHSLPEKNGRKTRLVVVTDITERIKAADHMKLAMEKAESSDRLKTTFLNNISHEVRTPLNGILGFAELISQEDISDSEKNEAIEMVYESSDRLLKTITNYMDISLLISGSLSVNIRNSSPSILLKGIYDKFKTVCSNRKIDLILKTPDSGLNISLRADPEILEKILTHFMDNAVKFTEAGSIMLGYETEGKNINFFVKDTGIGISDKSLTRIFNRFVKEDNRRDRISEGSGLGLAIVKGMAELTGGKIHVNSEPGKGSAFFITLLLTEPGLTEQTEKPGVSFSGADVKNTILIAEDDEINFFYMNALLARETDSKILRAENGREAIELVKSNNDIKLILMDIKMPEIDGLEATRQIKLTNPDIPIIAITAYAMSGDEERVLAAGCDGYLSKPISKEKLLKKMAELVTA